MMKGSDIGIQEKKAKLFNEWERFASNEGESIESYYYRFLKLMNDLKRNKHFSEKIASNLKFLNNVQSEWSRHVTIVHQTKDLHTSDYTQLYDFLKYNQKEVDELKAERLAKIQDPLALMANSNNPYAFSVTHQDLSPFNQNYLQQPMPNPEDITDPTTALNMALALMAKAFKLNYSTPTNTIRGFHQTHVTGRLLNRNVRNQVAQNQRVLNVGNQNGLIGVQGNGNQNQIGNGNLVAVRAEENTARHNGNQIRCYNCRGIGHFARDCTVRPRRRNAAYLQTQLLIAQKEEARIQLQAEEYDLMAAAADLDEIEEVNANSILMANLQQASSSGTQTDKAPVYDFDESAESWLWHQRLSHLNFDTINDLARNDLVAGLPKFKYHKEHLCPSCEQGKSKRASHPPKPVPNSRQRLHLLHMDLCGPMRIASINGKRIYNCRTKKIMETMNVSFDELSAMAFGQRSSKPRLQCMTSGQISS
nr:retrovirus-related Pol polyprotein from transposon TNT 1-94 [Tanacetum cinerariifolium]